MDNNDIYIRKDLHDAQEKTILVLIDKTNERIDDLKDTISRHFSVLGIIFTLLQIAMAVVFYFLK